MTPNPIFVPPDAHHAATTHDVCVSGAANGAIWFVMVLCLLEAAIFFFLAQSVGKRSRTFHYFAYLLMLLPALAYGYMISGYGMIEGGSPWGDHCFYTARWLMLLVEIPLLVTTAGLMAGVVGFDLSMLAIAGFIIPLAGLLGGLVARSERWMFFVIAVMAAIPVLSSLWNRFGIKEAEATGFDHHYTAVISTRLTFLCTTLTLYLSALLLFWVLSPGTGIILGSTELLILALIDLVMISAFCITLLSDRETIEKMSEYNARSMGWTSGGGGYGSVEESSSGPSASHRIRVQ